MRETLQLLWNNHHILIDQVDLEVMSQRRLETLTRYGARTRLFQVSAWLARQGFFLTAWSLWEFYSHGICESLTNPVARAPHDSCVEWVRKSLAANGEEFPEYDWFVGANSMRNLLAHCCGRVVGREPERLLAKARTAFPNLTIVQGHYISLDHPDVADLQEKIEDFIDATA